MTTVSGSTNASRASATTDAPIRPTAAALRPSIAARNVAFARSRSMNGWTIPTRTKAGRKIPSVATSAPGIPAIRYPRNVAEVKTGPGVSCPIAIASRTWSEVTYPGTTSSLPRKATST